MTTTRARVAAAATAAINQSPVGVRWADLFRHVGRDLPDLKHSEVVAALHHFRNHLPEGICQPDRGLYSRVDAAPKSGSLVVEPATSQAQPRPREHEFYQAFADWLVGDLEEASRASAIGGSAAGSKWGTPDVIGLFEAKESDVVKFTREVVAAEIKTDPQSLIVAFGQACAYKLFAHRVYIVVPRSSHPSDLKRLDALAGVVGIGLVKFDADNPENPDFAVMVRAAKHEPDYYYTNELLGKFRSTFGL